MSDEQDEKFMILIESLQARLGRLPTEDEVVKFIIGTKQEREAIWNQTH